MDSPVQEETGDGYCEDQGSTQEYYMPAKNLIPPSKASQHSPRHSSRPKHMPRGSSHTNHTYGPQLSFGAFPCMRLRRSPQNSNFWETCQKRVVLQLFSIESPSSTESHVMYPVV